MDAIRLIGVGKQYRRGARREAYDTVRDNLVRGVRSLAARVSRRGARSSDDWFWALDEVSLAVPQGAAVGLIGANGAGKSTLLKILSRVTAPSCGEVQLDGRVGSLLEVGTGFHPELTGRENVLLNGAILGMRRAEVLAKFDPIVDFAETGAFIDTPVKHYSSGMYLRLAFSVAAHLQPDILLVDEVLAVGDAAFQKRCLGRMNDVAREGRTVVFVSHNLEAIRRLCSHAVLLEHGRVTAVGDTADVVARYLADGHQRSAAGARTDLSQVPRTGTGLARFVAATVSAEPGDPHQAPESGGPLEFLLELESNAAREVRSLAVFLTDQYGTKVLNADTLHAGRTIALREGRTSVKVRLDAVHLMPGVYRVGLWLADPVQAHGGSGAYDFIESAFEVELTAPDLAPTSIGGLVSCAFDVEVQP